MQAEDGDARDAAIRHAAEVVCQAERRGANLPFAGTPEQLVEKLQGMQALGMTYAITYFAEAAYDTSGLELFESAVMPALL